jgi:hypothetical protein
MPVKRPNVPRGPRKPKKKVSNKYTGPKTRLVNTSRTFAQNDHNMHAAFPAPRVMQRPHPSGDISYLLCRLDPFNHLSDSGLPDGASVKLIRQTLRSYVDFTLTSFTPLFVDVVPMLPYTVNFRCPQASSAYTFASSVATYTIPVASSSSLYNYCAIPACAPALFNTWVNANWANPFLAQSPPLNMTTGRITAFGWRLVYTGAANSAQGIINIRTNALGIDGGVTENNTTIAGYVTGGGYVTMAAAGTIQQQWIQPLAQSYNYANPEEVVVRPETSPHGTLRHAGPFPFKDFHEQAVVPVVLQNNLNNLAPSSSELAYFQSAPASANNPAGICWFDPDWQITTLTFSPVPVTGMSYRLETIVCLEATVTDGSPVAAFTTSAAKANVPLLDAANAANNKQPVAQFTAPVSGN